MNASLETTASYSELWFNLSVTFGSSGQSRDTSSARQKELQIQMSCISNELARFEKQEGYYIEE